MSVLAVDIGSSRIKALLADWDGRIVETRSTSTPRQSEEPGEQAYRVEAVHDAIEDLIAGLSRLRPRDGIDTIVFSCLGTAMAPLDREGRPLGGALSPADARPLAGPGLDESVGIGAAELTRRTGSDPAVASFLLHSLWWQRAHPEVMERLHRFRSLRGYSMRELCDADAEDLSWASRTMLLDLETGRWSEAILEAAGVPGGVMPPIEPPTAVWPVRREVAERLGLAPGAAAVLGAMDNCCSLFGATDSGRSALTNIVGTYEHMTGAASLEEVRAVAAASGAVIHGYLLPGRYIAMTRVPMGDLISCVRAADDGGLDRLMGGVSVTPRDVDIPLEPAAIGAAIDAGRPRIEVLQALLESGAAVLKRFADAWQAEDPTLPIAAVGGGVGHPAVLQLKANLLGRPLATLASDESAGLGALRLAAMATQGFSAADAVELFANPTRRVFAPASNAVGPSSSMPGSTAPVSTHGGA